MKSFSLCLVLAICGVLATTSCQNNSTDPVPAAPREVQFTLYTDKDFSTENGLITFRASIQNNKNQTLWDSVLAPMKIKDIPNLQHKIVFNKSVSTSNSSVLKVGFYYTIENVGNSWHLDSFNAGETFKAIDFNFH